MGKSENNSSQPTEAARRPSLFSADTSASEHNILDSMSSQSAVTTSAKPKRGVWLLVPFLAAAVWGGATYLRQTPATLPDVQAVVTSPSTATPAHVHTPAPTPPAPTAAASDTFPAMAAAHSDTIQAHAPAPFGKLAEPQTPSLQPPPKSAPKTKTPAKTATASKKSASSVQAGPAKVAKTSVAKAKTPAAAKTPAKTAAVTSKPTTGQDADVELLSAIMRHLGDEYSTTASPARPVQTIAALVKSCKGNGKSDAEALRCQRRICEGSWGKAEACPQDQASKQTATTRAAVSEP